MKLTDALKSKIILEYAEGATKSEIAKKYGISRVTLDKLLKENVQTLQNLTHKKEEIEEDILEHMEKCRGKVITIIDKYLDALSDDERIDAATMSQLTTALGTLIDKWTMVREGNTEAEVRLAYLVKKDAPEQPPEDIEEESDE